MLSDRQLQFAGLEDQPDSSTAHRVSMLCDLHNGSIQRLFEIIASEKLLQIGIRVGQPDANVEKLTRESYFWSRVPEVFHLVAQEIAALSPRDADTAVDD